MAVELTFLLTPILQAQGLSVPSSYRPIRSEPLRLGNQVFPSEGLPSPWDWDVDDMELSRFRGRVNTEIFTTSLARGRGKLPPYASPTEPIEGRTPTSLQRSPNAIDVYWVNSSGHRNTSRKEEELRWRQSGAEERIELYVDGCVHQAVRRRDAASIGRGSGKRSLDVCRARRLPWRQVCPPLSGRAGFAHVVACHPSIFVPSRGAISRSLSEKRSPFFEPVVVALT